MGSKRLSALPWLVSVHLHLARFLYRASVGFASTACNGARTEWRPSSQTQDKKASVSPDHPSGGGRQIYERTQEGLVRLVQEGKRSNNKSHNS